MSEEVLSTGKHLEPVDFWIWKHYIAEMNAAGYEKKIIEMQYAIMLKELEMQKLRLQLLGQSVNDKESVKIKAGEAYQEFRKSLETKYDVVLSSCIIDEISYEIKKIEEIK